MSQIHKRFSFHLSLRCWRWRQTVNEILKICPVKSKFSVVPSYKASECALSRFIRVYNYYFELLLFAFLGSPKVVAKCPPEDEPGKLIFARQGIPQNC
jgi:hypothetical protein